MVDSVKNGPECDCGICRWCNGTHPGYAELREFEAKARRVHITQLGDMLANAEDRAHADIAAAVLRQRLEANDLDGPHED